MKSLPVSEQPYEKCLEKGPAYLSDAELLAVIIRSGNRKETAVDVAGNILLRFGAQNGLAGLAGLSADELRQIDGIGPVKAVQLSVIGEICRRISRATCREQLRLDTPASLAAYFMEDMRHLDREEICLAMFNTKGMLLHSCTLSRGTVSMSVVSPRDIFMEAMRHKAVYIALLHNHPSGDPSPSREDILLTERVKKAGSLLDIPLADHIIIGDNRFISLKERGYL